MCVIRSTPKRCMIKIRENRSQVVKGQSIQNKSCMQDVILNATSITDLERLVLYSFPTV